jgi:uncharacterized repeat protein (TIGR01451 family)
MLYKYRSYFLWLLPMYLAIAGWFLFGSSATAGVVTVDKWAITDDSPDPTDFPHVIAGEELFYYVEVCNGDTTQDLTVRDTQQPNSAIAGRFLSVAVSPTSKLANDCEILSDNDGTTDRPDARVVCKFTNFPDSGHCETIELKFLVDTNYVAGEDDGTRTFANRARVLDDGPTLLDEDSVTTTVEDEADLKVTKICKPDGHLNAGETGICYVNIENLGLSDSRNVMLTDSVFLPAGATIGGGQNFEWLSVDANQAGCPSPAQLNMGALSQLICNYGTLPKGGVFTVKYTFLARTAMDVNNIAEATCHANVLQGTPDPDCDNNSAESTVSFDASADLSIVKTIKNAQANYKPGDTFEYQLDVTNNGPSTAQNVTVEDFLPAGLAFLSLSTNAGTCLPGTPGDPSDPVFCSLGNIGSGGMAHIEINVRVLNDAISPLVNKTRVSSDTFDPDLSNNIDSVSTVVVRHADLSITKESSPADIVIAGEELLYYVTVENLGPDDTASSVLVNDTLPTGVVYLADTCGCNADYLPTLKNCNFEVLAAGDSNTCVIKVRVPSSFVVNKNGVATIKNTATIVGFGGVNDDNSSNNTASKTNFIEEESDLRVTKLCKPDASLLPAGEEGSCKIIVDNLGTSDARDVEVTDLIFSDKPFMVTGIDIISAPMGAACIPGMLPADSDKFNEFNVDCDLGDLSAQKLNGANRAEVLVRFVSNFASNIDDIATVDSLTPDPDTDNNIAEGSINVEGVADLSVDKSDSPDPVIAGEMLTYTIDIKNNGPSKAVNVVVSDIVPAGVTIDSVSGGMGVMCNTGVPGDPTQPTRCFYDTLASGDMRTMTIITTVLPQIRGTIHNDVCASSATFDDNNSNDCDTENTTVNGEADLSLTKEIVNPQSGDVKAGDPLAYLITIENLGPSTATGIKLTDTLPDQTDFVDVQFLSGSGTCQFYPAALFPPPSAHVDCLIDDLDPGKKAIISLRLKVRTNATDTEFCNTATVSSTKYEDPETGNNSDTVCINAIKQFDVWMEKDGNFPTGNPSGYIQFFCTVHNDTGCSANPSETTGGNVCGLGGPSDATNVVMKDTMPLNTKKLKVQFVSPGCIVYNVSCGGGTCQEVQCTANTIKVGDKVVYEIQAQIQGSIKSDILNTCRIVTPDGNPPDPDPSNNTFTRRIVVQGGTGTPGGPKGPRK